MKMRIKIVAIAVFVMLSLSGCLSAQTADTIFLNYKIPTVFENLHTPGMHLVVWDNKENLEENLDSTCTMLFPNVIVSGVTECKYGIEFYNNIVEIVFLKSKNQAGVRNIRNFVIDLCPDFTLTKYEKSIYTFCGNIDFQGIPCLICYTENRNKGTALMEISSVKD